MGNIEFKLYKVISWDVFLEWYYDDISYFLVVVFNKEVEDFIVGDVVDEFFFLESGEYVFSVLCFCNGDMFEVEGLEFVWLYMFESGFGI